MTNNKKIRAGIVQFDVKKGDIEANLVSACDGLRQLHHLGAELALLPELWSCGFDTARLDDHADQTPEIIKEISRQAESRKMMIAGSLPEKFDKHIYNTMYLISGYGSTLGTYRKIHMFSYINEDQHFQAGSSPVICDTPSGTFGLMVCYDLRFPELCRALTLKKAQIILISAQWPESRIHHWDILLKARAIENQIFIVATNRCGFDDELKFNGHSQIVSPKGKILTTIEDKTSVAIADLHLQEIDKFRNQFNCIEERVSKAYAI